MVGLDQLERVIERGVHVLPGEEVVEQATHQ